jgi:hypothetical protein
MVHGLPPLKSTDNICSSCVAGKQHRLKFKSGKPNQAKAMLDLIHNDQILSNVY